MKTLFRAVARPRPQAGEVPFELSRPLLNVYLMKFLPALLVIVFLASGKTFAQSFPEDVAPLIESSCIYCHDVDTETDLNFETVSYDLHDPGVFRGWEKVFDRVAAGEMPPESEERPDSEQLKLALGSLGKSLRQANLSLQAQQGRVPARRLTRLEYQYTIADLLGIGGDLMKLLPAESDASSFDTVGASQRISAVHMDSYLKAADAALKQAIHLGQKQYRVGVNNFAAIERFHDPATLGGGATKKLTFGDGLVLFVDLDYITTYHFSVTTPGVYRITSKVAAYQSNEPVTAKVIVKNPTGGARLAHVVDLEPRQPETVEFDTYLEPGDIAYLTLENGKDVIQGFGDVFAGGGAKNYKGKGLAIMSQKVEGPIIETWPTESTQQLLYGTRLVSIGPSEDGPFEVELSREPIEHVAEIVGQIAPRVFRRPPTPDELDAFIRLADPAIQEGLDFVDIVWDPLRSMLTSPQFLMFDGKAGKLDDFALANRLSYFLWKSMPDEELFALADQGKLSDSKVLAAQIDRLLDDEKSNRFVRDFLGQWLWLYKINATTPDDHLYPEYDEVLGDAMPREPELFFAELINENLSLTNLIDSDFALVNSRLATHYGIPDVTEQEFQKVDLAVDSPRGGVLTQAAILKTTANGTVTSPVTRGNFVLTNLLGTPPLPPPPLVETIEPDTRGQTTIRETLDAHRNIETCNKCHQQIDPPGFALESFDAIGRFRSHYRVSTGDSETSGFTVPNPPKPGLPVDASGITADGKEFSGIQEFKQHLLDHKEQVARNFISKLVVYSTGSEIQFADREQVEAILDRTRASDFPVRDIIHEVIGSNLFTNL